jgi:hypothetical protein
MIEVKADKWTLKQDSFIGWSLLRHGEPCKVPPDNCHIALAWELAYVSGQEPLTEPVLPWHDYPGQTEHSFVEFLGMRLTCIRTIEGTTWVRKWELREPLGCSSIAQGGGYCQSLREGKVLCEAALRKYWWGKLMPEGTDR